MLEIICCEDNKIQAEVLSVKINKIIQTNGLPILPCNKIYNSGEAMLLEQDIVRQADSPNTVRVYFLDINLGKGVMTGLQTAEKIRESDAKAYIIFITASRESIAACFKYHTFNYILKPIDWAKLEECVLDVYKAYAENFKQNTLKIKINSISVEVPYEDVMYIKREKGAKFATVQLLHNLKAICEESLSTIETNSNGYFFRSHRAYLANLKHVKSVDMTNKLLNFTDSTNAACLLSDLYKSTLKERLKHDVVFI
jgi:DNA-binding LytR/AlgR family response regulator